MQRDTQFTLCSSVIGGSNALESFLTCCVPPETHMQLSLGCLEMKRRSERRTPGVRMVPGIIIVCLFKKQLCEATYCMVDELNVSTG